MGFMRGHLAWRGVATLFLLGALVRPSHAGDPLKPYVFLIVDTSSSMTAATNAGPPSCPGSVDTRIDHAKCAINRIASSFGDMVLGVARFRETTTDTNPANGCTMNGACPNAATIDTAFEGLVGLFDGNNSDLVRWTDFTVGSCSSLAVVDNPEIFTSSGTPIAGSLTGAKRYWQGLQGSDGTTVLFPASFNGFDPIRRDPLRNVFLPSGRQCRPYIVISLTDGDESCSGNANAAATSLLTTVVDTRTYRIETKAIGFGQTAPYQPLEDLAHAGGAADGPGNEALYVNNEEELQIAITQIIADAVKFELCNNADDDCDSLVDEDFPDKNMACDNGMFGRCRGTGTRVCNGVGSGTVCNITMPGGSPITETCNSQDDDCDSFVDEGLTCSCSGVELCNNLDDDCDLRIDEGLTRDCGTDVGECVRGTETCAAGTWGGCTAVGPGTEVCDALDNDCDGVVDGLSRSCSTLPGGNPNVGPCHPGTQVCPPGGSGMFGACLGEVGPTLESCDTVDNDCDTDVDEDTGGADCSSTCGVGQTVCVGGVIQCQGSTTGGMETCNDFDDDCDTMIDEGVPDMGPCTMGPGGEPLCMPGVLRCVGGTYVCQGGEPARPEVCDCADNDCDTQTDEGSLCAGGATCTHCQCALPCAVGEFQCPEGRICVDNFCLIDPCFNVTCNPLPNGDKQVCDPDDGTCVRACDQVTCGPGQVCVGMLGECRPDDCTTFPDRCSATEECVAGVCVADPCAGVTCPSGEYCQAGDCHGTCTGVTCPTGQRCEFGECETDPCGGPCNPGFVCNEASMTCVNDPCLGRPCPTGEACNPQNGQCEQDPCLGVTCPNPGEVCRGGSCYTPPPPVDAGPHDDDLVTAGGGGGCAAGGGSAGAAGGALVALALGLALALGRRRRAGGPS